MPANDAANVREGRGGVHVCDDQRELRECAIMQCLKDSPVSILVADDDPDYQVLLMSALSEADFGDQAVFLNDDQQVMTYLRGEGEFNDGRDRRQPSLILLGLNISRKGGGETVDEIKSDPNLRSIPIVVLATSGTPEDISRIYELGANSLIAKPPTCEGLTELAQTITNYWFRIVSLPPG